MGNVIDHVIIMRCEVLHLTPFERWEVPTPIIEDEMT